MAAAPIAMYESTRVGGQEHNRLVLDHMDLVKRVALHLRPRIPPYMELDELIQVGMVGLIEAARAFDPDMGHEFEHFALRRVKGSMLDEVRRLSSLPRSAVAFNKSEQSATQALASELGRQPSQAELAEHMGKDVEQFQKERGNAYRFETFSMEVVTEEVLGLAADSAYQPEMVVEHEEFMGAVTDAIAELPERDQLVMQLYYVEELNLKEIGAILAVSESRVSQILSSVVKKLRMQLQMD
jgi:RNA polymerase sigma factor FliA